MQKNPRRPKALRVNQSPEIVSAGTRLAAELLKAGCSADVRKERVREVVADPELAEAILSFVDSQAKHTGFRGNSERIGGIYVAVLGGLLIWLFCFLFRELYSLVLSAPTEAVPAATAAFGQAILVRLTWRIVKASGISITDALNCATYPTVIHKPIVTTAEEDKIRRERLRLLIAEMVARMEKGARFRDLYGELTRIELTRSAAVWLLIQARIGLMIGVNFPPYLSRQRAYTMGAAALLGCGIGIWMVHARLHTPSQLYFLTMWTVLFSVEFIRPPRRSELRETV